MLARFVFKAMLAVALSLIWHAAALGLTIRADINDDFYLDGALLAPQNATGRFDADKLADGSVGSVQSGVLIDPVWVLGIAHAATPTTFTIGGQTYAVIQRINSPINPANPPEVGEAGDGSDLALFRLDAPVANVTPAPLYTGSIAALTGQVAIYTGAGGTGTGLTGATVVDDPRVRAGRNTIDVIGGLVNVNGVDVTLADTILRADFDAPSTIGVQALEVGLAYGDSGGGVFVLDGGEYKLAALHSLVLSPSPGTIGRYGQTLLSTSFSTPEQLSFIVGIVPEPASLGLLAAGLGLLVTRRRSV